MKPPENEELKEFLAEEFSKISGRLDALEEKTPSKAYEFSILGISVAFFVGIAVAAASATLSQLSTETIILIGIFSFATALLLSSFGNEEETVTKAKMLIEEGSRNSEDEILLKAFKKLATEKQISIADLVAGLTDDDGEIDIERLKKLQVILDSEQNQQQDRED